MALDDRNLFPISSPLFGGSGTAPHQAPDEDEIPQGPLWRAFLVANGHVMAMADPASHGVLQHCVLVIAPACASLPRAPEFTVDFLIVDRPVKRVSGAVLRVWALAQ